MSEGSAVKVVARFRPQNEEEITHFKTPCVKEISPSCVEVDEGYNGMYGDATQFEMDRVFIQVVCDPF